jgi:hypothetical protein
MGPVLFESLPWIFSFVAAVLLLQFCIILVGTGRRYFREVAIALVGLSGGVLGESFAISYNFPALGGLMMGVIGGALLGYYLRPIGVGLALAFLAYSVSGNLVSIEDVQYVAALVLFAYGLLLTDVAPSFVSGLLSAGIVTLLAEWVGEPLTTTLELVLAVAAVQFLAYAVPLRLASRNTKTGTFRSRQMTEAL